MGYGLLVPVFFVTSGLTLDLYGLIAHPAALAAVPGFLLALPFLLAAVEIGREMGMLDPAVGAGLVAAGLVSVLIFPAAALTLLPRPAPVPV